MSEDSTKEKLNIDSMDINARKDLFNKFVDAGGQVNTKPSKEKIVKAPPKRPQSSSKSKGRNPAKKEQKTPTPKPVTTKPISSNKDSNPLFNSSVLNDKEKSPMGKRFAFWFEAMRNGVINVVGSKVSPSLYTYITRNVISLMLENQSTLNNALYPSDIMAEGHKLTHEDIVKTFTDEEDLEILQRYIEMYNENTYREFLGKYKTSGGAAQPSSYINILIKMIKPIFITRNYSNRIKISAENVLIIYAKEEGMSKALLNKKLLLFKKSVDVIYGDFYNKLFALLKFASKVNINEMEEILDLLQITEEDYVGYYTKKRKEEEASKQKEIENSKKDIGKSEEEEKFDKMIEMGMGLIDKIVDYEKLKDNLEYIDSKDKVFRAMTLCDYLDSEYSVIFSNKYVKYNIILDDHQKIDYATDFNHAIMAISELNSKLNEYYTIAQSIVEITGDTEMRMSNRGTLIKERTAQLSLISKNLRGQYANVIYDLKKSIDKLMLNKDERARIIGNPDEKLSLSSSEGSGGKKRLSGTTVMSALTEAFYYITALNFLLSYGELSGNGMLIDESNAYHHQSEYIEENETNENGVIEIDDMNEKTEETVAVLNTQDEDGGEDPLIHTSKV